MLLFSSMLQLAWSIAVLVLDNTKMTLLAACKHLALASAIISTLPTASIANTICLPGYGNFVGTTVNQTLTKKPLPAPVDAWLGIDYATQPVGEGRFAHPNPPVAFQETKNATQYGFSCIQDPADLSYEQDEACLSMNIFRPKNNSSTKKLPVLIWIHGVSKQEGLQFRHY
jgi:acetylcholinesterase